MAEVRALQDVGQFSASIVELREILAISPDLPEAAYRLGVALVQTGEPSRAVWALQKAAESPSYAIVAGLLLASAQLNIQNYEEAVRAADRVLEIDPERQVALQLRAKGYLGSGNLEKALEDTERLVALYPEDYSVRVLHATVLSDLDRIEEAKGAHDLLKQLGESSGDPAVQPRACLAPAIFAKDELEDPAAAEPLYEDCIAKYPGDSFVIDQSMDFFDAIGKPERSTELIRAAVEQSPESLPLRGTLAGRLRGSGDIDGAETVLREAVESFNSAQAWNMLAAHYRRVDQPEQALEAIEKVLELSRGESDQLLFTHADLLIDLDQIERAEMIANELKEPTYAKLIRGRIHLKRGDPSAALQAFDQGIRNWPNNAGARYLAGLAARELGDYDRAISELREAVRADKSATEAAILLAHIHLERGEYQQAANFANTALEGPSGRQLPQAYVIGARAFTELGRYERARKSIDNLAALPGQETVALVELAAVTRAERGPQAAADLIAGSPLVDRAAQDEDLMRAWVDHLVAADRADEALRRLDAATSARPDAAALHELRGSVLVRTGRTNEAEAAYTKALELGPDDAAALSGLATVAAGRGEIAKAIELFDRAAELSPDQPLYAYSASQLALQSGDVAGAEQRLREIVKQAPGHAGSRNDLAWLLSEKGQDLDLALSLAQEARRLEPTPEIIDTVGWVHLKRGESEAAVTALEEALSGRPDSPSIRYHLGVALRQAGYGDRAREMLRTAIDAGVFPEAEDARRELAQLEQ